MDPAAQEVLMGQDPNTLSDEALRQQIQALSAKNGQLTAISAALDGPQAAGDLYTQSAKDLKDTQDTLKQLQAAHGLTPAPHTVTDPAAQEILQSHAANTAQQLAAPSDGFTYGSEKPFDLTPDALKGGYLQSALDTVGAGIRGLGQGATLARNMITGGLLQAGDKLGLLANPTGQQVPMSPTNPTLVNPRIRDFYNDNARYQLQMQQENPGLVAGTGRFVGQALPTVQAQLIGTALGPEGNAAAAVLTRGATGALIGAGQSVPGEVQKNALEGGALNMVLPGAGSFGAAMAQKTSDLPAADLKNLLASGLNPTLGQATGFRPIRGFENSLRDTSQYIGGNEQTFVEQAEKALQQVRDVAPIAKAEIPAAREAYKTAYNNWAEALPAGTKIPMTNTIQALDSLKGQLTQGLAGTGTDVTAKVLDNMNSLRADLVAKGGKIDPLTIQKTMTQLNKLSAASSKPEMGAMKDYASTTKYALQQDMMAHAQTTGNPELVSNLQKANQMFQDVKDSNQIHNIVDRGITRKGEVNPQIAAKAINAASNKPLPPISTQRMGALQQIANNIRSGKLQMVAPPKVKINPSAIGKTLASPLTIPLSYYTRNVMNQPGKFGTTTNGILEYLLGTSNQQRYQPQ